MVCVMVRAGGGLCALEPREFQGDVVECGMYAGLCGKPKERLSMVVCVVQSRDYQYAMLFVQLTKGKEVSMMMTWRERDADEENFFCIQLDWCVRGCGRDAADGCRRSSREANWPKREGDGKQCS